MVVRVRLTGDRAVFARPEFASDLVSYDLITPHAARGVMNALYGDLAVRWTIEAIAMLAPIRRECLHQSDRRVVMLRGVVYNITARMVPATMEADMGDHADRFVRAMATPPVVYLGYIGCKAHATLIDDSAPRGPAPDTTRVDHGWLLHHIDPGTGRPRYFRAESVGGVVAVPPADSPAVFE